ncbi:MAG TPA: beta-1,6-N-acetylglucosaminyltransferase [Anaeromyxobacter sp.]|nr:beta-1,6-N-acetylglucosaminyltransferase [Anaeromyxobacter sp.]
MTEPIGFALLTHFQPGQVLRLVTRLRALYGPATPIAINHNFDQCALDTAVFPADVRWVRPHLATDWGAWSLVEAALATLRLLHGGGGGPDYAVLLSGADYPIAPRDRVLTDLREAGADAFIDARPVHPWRRDRVVEGPHGLGVNEGRANQEVCFRRYYSSTYRVAGVRVRVRSPLLAPLLSPFSRGFRCFAGEHWWTLGRRGVEHLLRSQDERPEVARWFAARHVPEEAYVHTVICNAPGLRVAPRSFRYVDWSSRAPHPRILGTADLPALLASGDHFARKFAEGDSVLDELDRILGLSPTGNPPGQVSGQHPATTDSR